MDKNLLGAYAVYYDKYIDLVPKGEILNILDNQVKEVIEFISRIDDEKSKFKYAENKWSIREVFGHVLETERIFAYRALRFSRNDKNEIAGSNQTEDMPHSNYENIPLANLLEEFILVRKSNVMLFNTFTKEMWMRTGTANKNLMSVRAITYIMVGHCIHHLNVIRDKYLL